MSIQAQSHIHGSAEARLRKARLHDPLASLASDVRIVAHSVFQTRRDAARIDAAMRGCIRELRRLQTPDPLHPQWSHVAILIELLVCSAGAPLDGATQRALTRLTEFNVENRDLLFVEAR